METKLSELRTDKMSDADELNLLIQMYGPHFRLLAGYVSDLFNSEDMQRFRELSHVHYDGTLEPIYAHFMSIGAMRRGEANLRAMAYMAKFIQDIQKVLNDEKPLQSLDKELEVT